MNVRVDDVSVVTLTCTVIKHLSVMDLVACDKEIIKKALKPYTMQLLFENKHCKPDFPIVVFTCIIERNGELHQFSRYDGRHEFVFCVPRIPSNAYHIHVL